MEANFIKGVITGKVRIFNLHNELQGVGIYQNGLPHGPFWLLYQDHYVQIHVNQGRIGKNHALKKYDQFNLYTGYFGCQYQIEH